MHQVLRVKSLPHNEKIKYLTAEDSPVAHVVSIREEVVRRRLRLEAATVATAGTPAEPEVAKKGKGETEAGGKAEGGEKPRRQRSKTWRTQPSSWARRNSVLARFWWSGWAIPAWSTFGRRITRGLWQSTASRSRKALWFRTGGAGLLLQAAGWPAAQ